MDNRGLVEESVRWYLADAQGDAPPAGAQGGGHDALLAVGGYLSALVDGGACAGVYAHGPAGTGKTRTALALARGICPEGVEPIIQPCHPGLTSGDVWGYYLPTDTGARWVDGCVSSAWRKGVPLVCDELGRALGSEAEAALLTAFSGAGIAAVTLPTGETLRPPSGWAVLATGNTPAEDLPEPLRERFLCVETWGPSAGALRSLAAGLPEVEASALIRAVGSHYRPAARSGGFEGGLAYRVATHYRSLRLAGAPVDQASDLAFTPAQSAEWVGTVGLAAGNAGSF